MSSYELKTWDGATCEVNLPFELLHPLEDYLLFPALIDAHVHFRTPGHTYKEDWVSGGQSALNGGVTTVFDMPNNDPPISTVKALEEKKVVIDKMLASAQLPLNYRLYLGASASELEEMERLTTHPKLLKIFMGSSTGGLLMEKEADIEKAFAMAGKNGVTIAVHAEDEEMIRENAKGFQNTLDPATHSKIRTPQVAQKAVSLAISLAKKYSVKLYLLHLSTALELEEIKKGKRDGVKILAEATPHHLFLSTDAYRTLETKAQVNPPLRCEEDRLALWKGVEDGVIDVIGSDHAPHLLEEKELPYRTAPSGVPGVETTLPLLANQVIEGKLSWERLAKLTSANARDFFCLEETGDLVLINLKQKKKVEAKTLASKAGWSPYEGFELKGWPVATRINGKWRVKKRETANV